MTAWTSAERAQLRVYLGFPSLFTQFEPRLEFALTAVQSQADGGALPDSSVQTLIRTYMTYIAAIDVQRQALYPLLFVNSADGIEKAKISPAAALFDLERQGRQWIGAIGIQLGLSRIPRDYYAGIPVDPDASDLFGGANSPFIGGSSDNG